MFYELSTVCSHLSLKWVLGYIGWIQLNILTEKNTRKFAVKQKHNEYNLCFKEIVCDSYLVGLCQMFVYQTTICTCYLRLTQKGFLMSVFKGWLVDHPRKY